MKLILLAFSSFIDVAFCALNYTSSGSNKCEYSVYNGTERCCPGHPAQKCQNANYTYNELNLNPCVGLPNSTCSNRQGQVVYDIEESYTDTQCSQDSNTTYLTWYFYCCPCPEPFMPLYCVPDIGPDQYTCVRCTQANETLTPSNDSYQYRCIAPCKPAKDSCDFYTCLNNNYNDCGEDGYPLGYGLKYCQAYGAEASSFSDAGQEWISSTRLCLQKALVSEATSATTSCDQLATDAFATHATCYIDSGVCSLPVADWLHIFRIVGLKNLVYPLGFLQAFSTAAGCAKFFAKLEAHLVADDLARWVCRITDGEYLCGHES